MTDSGVRHVEISWPDGRKSIQNSHWNKNDDGMIVDCAMSGTFYDGVWIVDPSVTCREVTSEEYHEWRRANRGGRRG